MFFHATEWGTLRTCCQRKWSAHWRSKGGEGERCHISNHTKELRPFLVLASYYRRFIPGFAKIARPLNEKSSDKVNFLWSGEMQTAFEELKVKLTSAPALSYSDYEKPSVVCTDAFSRALREVLFQADGSGRDHPIHFASWALCAAESSYSAFEREALGATFALKKFRRYLTSSRFKLYTDHQAFKYVFNMKDSHGRIAGWFTLLPEYDIEICFRRYSIMHALISYPNRSNWCSLMKISHLKQTLSLSHIYLHNLSVVDESISITPELK